jgi:hypothetical protein
MCQLLDLPPGPLVGLSTLDLLVVWAIPALVIAYSVEHYRRRAQLLADAPSRRRLAVLDSVVCCLCLLTFELIWIVGIPWSTAITHWRDVQTPPEQSYCIFRLVSASTERLEQADLIIVSVWASYVLSQP